MKPLAAAALLALAPSLVSAQTFGQRMAVIQAEARGAKSPADLQTIRAATRSGDTDTVRLAVRAMGRLQRPALAPELVTSLRHVQPEVRAEAANALAEAARGLKPPYTAASPVTVVSIQTSLATQLTTEVDPSVRAVIIESIARLPYRTAAEAERAEGLILELSARVFTISDRLGIAKALEALIRLQTPLRPAGPEALDLLKKLSHLAQGPGQDVVRDARVRRLALEALTAAAAVDESVLADALSDTDPQVRRLAIRAAGLGLTPISFIIGALLDQAPMVRIEALRALASRDRDAACGAAIKATTDPDFSVALLAIDTLGNCGTSAATVVILERLTGDRGELAVPRGWHHSAHALVALAMVAPDRAIAALPNYVRSPIWQVRMYAARAAAQARDRESLSALVSDPETRVAEAARAALGTPVPDDRKPKAAALAMGPFTTADLTRLAAPRARIAIRDVGQIELALFTAEAPAAVLRFARLAEAGYYNGLTFDRVVPNAVVQGGWRATDATRFPEEEIGGWPHVRGAVGVSEAFAPDGQFFIDVVDNPQFDHRYTVFAQVLNGTAVIDRILEGDVIESIEIVP